MRPLQPRERKIVALGVLVGLLAGIWLALVAPLLDGFQARAQRREQLLSEHQANRRLLDSVPTLQAAALEQRRTASLYQISAPTAAVATEALKQRLSTALSGAGGAVGAVQPVQAGVPAGWVSARAEVQIGLPQLVAAIRQLENEGPYVVVQYLSIQADRAASTGRAAPLDVRLQVSALFRPTPATPAAR
jgi:general secretion pathway protein M